MFIIYNNIRIREGIKMSKKFPINFKKSNNNLSIKKEEKNNVDELGLSTVESKEKEGYSP